MSHPFHEDGVPSYPICLENDLNGNLSPAKLLYWILFFSSYPPSPLAA